MRDTPPADLLFTPFTLGGVKLPNRLVMAPMTRDFCPDGVPGPASAAYYARRARHGIGLIVTEGTTVGHFAASSSPTVPRIHGEDALAGWKQVVDEVHAAGGLIFCQLWHVGLDPFASDLLETEGRLVGPSGLVTPDIAVGPPMTPEQIADVVAAFARGAADAKRVGFDGIELHGAHGYLISQFFWAGTNRRTDRYGGDIESRTRFAVEIIDACRAEVGPGFPIVLRYSQWINTDFTAQMGATPAELERFLAPLAATSVDGFHCSTRRFWEPEFEGSPLNLAGWTRKLTGKPVITVGSVGLSTDFISIYAGDGGKASPVDIGAVLDRLARQEFDLIAVGRAVLNDAAWVTKVRDGSYAEIRAFDPETLNSLV
jgi:2,4-dienoyl-CoA reductase-like NADH-dependent reductase (Old Yellow Enzyme family)